MLTLMPDKDRRKVLAMRSSASQFEVQDEKVKLEEWLSGVSGDTSNESPPPPPPPASSIAVKEGDIFGSGDAAAPTSTYEGKKSHPPVRGSKEAGSAIRAKAAGKRAGGSYMTQDDEKEVRECERRAEA